MKERYPSWEDRAGCRPGGTAVRDPHCRLANQKGPNNPNRLREITQERGEIDLDWLKEVDPEEARDWLVKLRGVGPKTAAIVMTFSLGMPAFPVDTHIYRVTGRIGLRPKELDVTKTHAYMEQIADSADFGSLHLNLIDLAARFARLASRKCQICPIKDLCQFEEKTEESKRAFEHLFDLQKRSILADLGFRSGGSAEFSSYFRAKPRS